MPKHKKIWLINLWSLQHFIMKTKNILDICAQNVSKSCFKFFLCLFVQGIDQNYIIQTWYEERDILSEFPYIDNDIYTIMEMVQDAFRYYDNNLTLFRDLQYDVEDPLYTECTKYIKSSRLIKLYNVKDKHECRLKFLKLGCLKNILPLKNLLPTSVYETRKQMIALSKNCENIHICPNDCILCRKQQQHLS